MGGRINTVMRPASSTSPASFPPTSHRLHEAVRQEVLRQKATPSFRRNYDAIDAAVGNMVEIKYPESWATTAKAQSPFRSKPPITSTTSSTPSFTRGRTSRFQFVGYEDGAVPVGTTSTSAAASPWRFPSGRLRPARSATAARSHARTPASVHSLSRKERSSFETRRLSARNSRIQLPHSDIRTNAPVAATASPSARPLKRHAEDGLLRGSQGEGGQLGRSA